MKASYQIVKFIQAAEVDENGYRIWHLFLVISFKSIECDRSFKNKNKTISLKD